MCVIDVGWTEDAEISMSPYTGSGIPSGPQQDIWGIESQWGRPRTPIFMTVKYSPAHLF